MGFLKCLIRENLQVESFNTERALRKIKRHNSSAVVDVSEPAQKGGAEFSSAHVGRLNLMPEEGGVAQSNGMEVDGKKLQEEETQRDSDTKSFVGGPSSWYDFSKSYKLLRFLTYKVGKLSISFDLLVVSSWGTLEYHGR